MIYRFGSFELDAGKVELRKDDTQVAVEPQVFALLRLLVENRDRMVSRDEIIEKVWEGRIVSDSALASRIKSARRALDDDGRAQRFIRTVHGAGFRFVADVAIGTSEPLVLPAQQLSQTPVAPASTKPSIAVLPFRLVGIAGPYAPIAEALPHDLIAELSHVRWLFVIARGSSFRFRSGDADLRMIGRVLGVRYCLSGTVEIVGNVLTVTVELASTGDGGVIWAERFVATISDVFDIRVRIATSIVAALEVQIPLNEARLARLRSTENLDAWAAYHLGLQQMYYFTKTSNMAAIAHFGRAIAQDANFARAYAGLSFAHFQNSFLHYTDDPQAAAVEARRFAEQGVVLDPLDPFVNFTMGRVFWLEGDLDGSLSWLERATTLRPNYAQGVYARAWTDTVSGRGALGQENADLAMALSPLDPLYYAMLATRALSHLVRGEYAEAAQWAERAARSPGAHVMIALIAVACHALNGDAEKAKAWADNARSRPVSATQVDFFRAFPFPEGPVRRQMAEAFARQGL
jgi:DNA-binding winged helix-turn-helix (wHTH) protein